ncbi:acyl-CoA dehydrogenase [Solicola sp. PLA-1-18]|uniref:acyl-CoA dehydrogenase family protein n=1 Tax=Solicola sp. PLA-1-18 TaxID=3380532 RepID=UPI003B82C4D9
MDTTQDQPIGLRVRDALDGRWHDIKAQSRQELAEAALLTDPLLDSPTARAKVLEQMKLLVETGTPAMGFAVDHGGSGDVGASVTAFEMLAYADLSLMVKAGVQWGLFGGAIENLGTERHHRAYIKPLIDLDLLGCFAMTETGHGSNVQELETTATYDPATEEFVLQTPTASARKDYIGGAGQHATIAAVFAQLVTGGETHGVHCFVVPIRDDEGHDLPGVTTSDCGPKAGLAGVDNGRIVFEQVRVPRENLLNRYADVAPDGTYSSSIENVGRRFFTMLGTLIRGRVSVGGAGGAAARVGLSIAVRYALQRRQFGAPGSDDEVLLMDYLLHQRRLFPLVAKSYALQFAQNELVAAMHDVQSADDPDEHAQRELEGRAAGLKAANTWHATTAIQEAREACGGAGYLAENRLVLLKADTDVFTTFEGDNHVLTQLVAKELLTAYASEVGGLDPLGMVRFATRTVADVVVERTAAQSLIQRLVDASPLGDDADLLSRGTQIGLFEEREKHLLETAARRLQRARKDGADAFAIFNAAQDHVVAVGRAHVDRVVLEAFVAGIEATADPEAKALLERVCDLYALSVLEADRAWFIEHKRLTVSRAKEIPTLVNRLCQELRPHALTLVEGLGVPEGMLGAAMLHQD